MVQGSPILPPCTSLYEGPVVLLLSEGISLQPNILEVLPGVRWSPRRGISQRCDKSQCPRAGWREGEWLSQIRTSQVQGRPQEPSPFRRPGAIHLITPRGTLALEVRHEGKESSCRWASIHVTLTAPRDRSARPEGCSLPALTLWHKDGRKGCTEGRCRQFLRRSPAFGWSTGRPTKAANM